MDETAPIDLIQHVANLLEDVISRAGTEFTGVGLIVTSSVDSLPIVPLRPTSTLLGIATTAEALSMISRPDHEHHDGFHILTPRLQIVRVAQYFSPPIVPEARINRQKLFGGRYLAALFGSMLPSVLATGIASRDFGVGVFQNGDERIHRAAGDPLLRFEGTPP
jgi:hypothetical protein